MLYVLPYSLFTLALALSDLISEYSPGRLPHIRSLHGLFYCYLTSLLFNPQQHGSYFMS